jgi:endonuclease/exonuclease/phosphatase family metal-dependent hydrolase
VTVHALVAHLGLIHASRCARCSAGRVHRGRGAGAATLLVVAGDFNDWGERSTSRCAEIGLRARSATAWRAPFRRAMPLFALDRVYLRGLDCAHADVPRGRPGHACPTTCRWWRSEVV